MLLGRVVDEDVNTSIARDDLGYELIRNLWVTHISGNRENVAAFFTHQPLRLGGIFLFILVEEGDLRPFPREQYRCGTTDTRISARDHRNLVLEPLGAAIAWRKLRARVHFLFISGLVLL